MNDQIEPEIAQGLQSSGTSGTITRDTRTASRTAVERSATNAETSASERQFAALAESVDKAKLIRSGLNWGEKYLPPIEGQEEYESYKRLLARIRLNLKEVISFGVSAEKSVGAMAEINDALEELYDCGWNDEDEIKMS